MINNGYLNLLLPALKLDQYLPAPNSLFSSAGSTITAAGIGGVSGLIGRAIYPDAGISPVNYALWFVVAYEIKEFVSIFESHFEDFMDVGAYFEFLDQVPEDELDFHDQIRYHCWKIIQYKTLLINKTDQVFCFIFNTRPYAEVTEENVYQASFLEMCRFRVWKVFKSTVLDAVSFSLAYRLCNGMGFTIPAQTALPLILVIQSIIRKIIIVPAIYSYLNLCNKLAEDLTPDEIVEENYMNWIKYLLPEM